jgi:hypothetical protein
MQDNKAAIVATPPASSKKESVVFKNAATYDEFILWFALPRHEKIKMGLETQEQFAEYHGLHRETVGDWKKRRDFLPRLKELRDMWGKERTQDVIAAIYFTAISKGVGAPASQKLWMQVIEGWSEKTEVQLTKKVELGVSDIRFIIEQLPDQLKAKFYGYLREIFDTAQSLRHAGQLPDRASTDTDAAQPLPREADQHAQELPKQKGNEVAESYPRRLRGDMEWQALTFHHQSAARWGQE